MLWHKRGLQALLVHRFKRIFLPLVIGLFTIIPVTWAVSAYVRSVPNGAANSHVEAGASQSSQTVGQLDIWAAAALDDVEAMKQFI